MSEQSGQSDLATKAPIKAATEMGAAEPRPAPDLPTRLSLLLLLLLALLLLGPLLLQQPPVSPYLIIALLVARLGLQIWRAKADPRLKRPVNWALDVLLIGLLFSVLA